MSEKTEINVLHTLLGPKVKNILRLANDIQKYLWEQSLAVCLYSRNRLTIADNQFASEDESAADFANRIRLVHCIIQLKSHKKIEDCVIILDLLDKGESSYDIVDTLKQMDLVWIIRQIEKLNIAFPKKHSRHHYTYLQMYQSLTNAIDVFKNLLQIDISENFIADATKRFFNKKLAVQSLLPNKKPYKSLNMSLDDIYSEHKTIMHDNEGKLISYIQEQMLKLFEGKCKTILPRSIVLNKDETPSYFEKNTSIFVDHDAINISINSNYLQSMVSIGQYCSVISSLRELILQKTANENLKSPKQAETNIKSTRDQKLSSIAKWQKDHAMGIVKRLDQCPRTVASIIHFDLQHEVGLFDHKISSPMGFYIDRNRTLSRNEVVHGITRIIRYFLYFDYTLGESITASKVEKEDFFLIDNDSSKEELNLENLLPNKMMEDWCNNNLKQTTELFKKIPKYLFKDISGHIENQIANSCKNSSSPFPLNTEIPMPFWVKV